MLAPVKQSSDCMSARSSTFSRKCSHGAPWSNSETPAFVRGKAGGAGLHTKPPKCMQHHQVATYMDEAVRRFLLVFEASCLASLDTGSSGGCCSTALPDWAETLHEMAGARPVCLEAQFRTLRATRCMALP